ncbi:MAG: ABC transporter permease [Actinobacteria bacterium]|nr:ABC transporter permease [Actinomycetota bacterium]
MNMIRSMDSTVKRVRFKKNFWEVYGVPIAFIVLFIIFSFANDKFLTFDNQMNILRATSIIAIVAIGTTIMMLSGNIDISMASTMAISGVVTIGLIVDFNINPVIAIICGMLTGILCGLVNSFFTIYVKIPAFIATLATLSIYRGLSYIYTKGYSIYGDQITDAYKFIGRGYLLKIPMPVIIMLVLYAIFIVIFKYTKLGLYTYAIGSNERVSLLSGVKSNRIKMVLFLIGGLTSSIGGIIMTSRLGSVQGGMADGMEFGIITAVVIGGTSISGGKGLIARTLLGALFIGILNNAMVLMNISTFYQLVTSGAVLLFALTLDRLKSRQAL